MSILLPTKENNRRCNAARKYRLCLKATVCLKTVAFIFLIYAKEELIKQFVYNNYAVATHLRKKLTQKGLPKEAIKHRMM